MVKSIWSFLALLEPGVSFDGLDVVSFHWICVENPCEHIDCCSGQPIWNFIVSSHDLLVEFRSNGIFEREVSTDHGVKDYSRAPDVYT
jgi:hypothetical protein